MGDGPFREPQEPGNAPGRARYGGLSPLVEDMGKPKPKSSDPYFTPPSDGTPGRGRPYLDPPAFKPGGEQQNPGGQPPVAPAPEVRQPEQPKWTPPKNTPDWNTKQPYSDAAKPGQQQQSPLGDAIGSKSKLMVESRDVQRGSNLSKAIIGGTAAGLFGEPLIKVTGAAADKGIAVQGDGLFSRGLRSTAEIWKNNVDPVGIHSSQIAKEESIVGKAFAGVEKTYTMDEQLLTKMKSSSALLPEERAHLLTLKTGLGIKDDAKLVQVLMERQAHFNPTAIKALNSAETVDHLAKIRALELSADQKILTTAERGLLETRSLALKNIGTLEVAAKEAGTEAKWFTGKGAWSNFKTAFGLTLGSGAAIEIDHTVRDRMYGKDAKSLETTSLTVPLAMALGAGFKGKTALTVGAVLGGHLIDGAIPNVSVPESLKHFTAWDAVPMGLAFVMPSKSKMVKAALVGGAWALGNTAESAFTGPSAGDIESRAIDTSKQDKTERTFGSFEKTVEGFKELGQKNEIILEQNLGQLLVDSNKNYKTMSQEEKLGAHRTTAALARALGEYRLEHGTRLAAGTTDRPTYILDGLDLDMGGDALAFLQMSRNSVKGSQAMTKIMMDNQAFGTKVTEQEVKDLDRVADKVNADINKITGKHDLEKAMGQLSNFIERGTTASGATLNKEIAFHKTFVEELNKKLGRNMPNLRMSNGEMNPDAALMVSKLLRDQALAKLAQTAYKLDHGDDPIGAGQLLYGTPQGRNEILPGTDKPKGFDGAMQAIMLAEKLAPDNPDLAELKAIATRLHEQVQAKAPSQYSNYKTNPLGVRP